MIRRLALLLSLLVLAGAAGPCSSGKRVLFVGNSYTYTNDLPRLVEQIAASKGVKLQAEAVTAGGARLMDHWRDGRATAVLRESRFDFVVIQPQSSEVIRMPEETAEYATKFAEAIRASGAEPVFFAPWHPREFDHVSAQYRSGYRKIAQDGRLRLAPIDAAWESAQAAGAQLYNADQVHPNLAGSYLAACVLVSIITGVDPAGAAHPAALSDADAANLQRAAWEAVRSVSDGR